jgi:DNA-binding response OmpR family regulator
MIIKQKAYQQLRLWSKDGPSFHRILHYIDETTCNNGQLVVHIDDDSVYLDALGDYLDCAGFRVISLSSAADALEAIRELSPSLIIIDYYMPEVDGPTLFKEISALPAAVGVPVVFLTSAADDRINQSKKDLEALFLSKQQPPDLLVSRFSELISSGPLSS